MTLKEKVQIYESFFHQIQLNYTIGMNSVKVKQALDIIDGWSYAHRVGNGEYSDAYQQKMVDRQAERMRDYV